MKDRLEPSGFRFFLTVWAACLTGITAGTYAGVALWGGSIGSGGVIGGIVGPSFFLAVCAGGGRRSRLRKKRNEENRVAEAE